MVTALYILHVLVCLAMLPIILLQSGRGGGVSAVFGGGGSGNVFGSRGASNFLTRMTTGAAIIFMMTSMGLSYVSSQDRSVVANLPSQDGAAPEPEAGQMSAAEPRDDQELDVDFEGDEPENPSPPPAPGFVEPAPEAPDLDGDALDLPQVDPAADALAPDASGSGVPEPAVSASATAAAGGEPEESEPSETAEPSESAEPVPAPSEPDSAPSETPQAPPTETPTTTDGSGD